MNKKRIKRGDIVQDNNQYYIFLKTEGKYYHLLSIVNGANLGEIVKLKSKDIRLAETIPEHLKRYSIT